MNLVDKLKDFIFKKNLVLPETASQTANKPLKISDDKKITENPYLTARRIWNDHVGSVISRQQTWQVIGILSLLIAFASIGGIIHIGSQSKFIPYIVEVDKLGQTVVVGPVQAASMADRRVIHATVAQFITDARTVTPDVALQRNAIFRIYAKLSPNDPATPKMNEWLNGTTDSSPFKRAEKEMVNVEIKTVIPQTPDTWQVEWEETIRDRQGTLKDKAITHRALVTVYIAEVTPQTTDEQLRNNPLSVYMRDFSWSRVQ